MPIQEGVVEAKAEDEFDAEALFAEVQAEMAGQGSDLPDADKAKDEAAAEAKTGQEDKTPPDAAAASDKEPEGKDTDIWATAPPALKAAYESERQARERWETTARGHARSASQAGRRIAELEATLPQGKGNEAPKGETDDERQARYAKLREDYPDSVAPVLDELETLRGELAKVTGAVSADWQQRSEADLLDQYALLDQRHPTWRQDVVSDSYVKWAEAQPKPVLDAISANATQLTDGVTAAWVIDLWKRDTQAPDPEVSRLADKRAEQLEAGRGVNVKAPAATAKDAATDPEQIWAEIQAERARKRAAAR